MATNEELVKLDGAMLRSAKTLALFLGTVSVARAGSGLWLAATGEALVARVVAAAR